MTERLDNEAETLQRGGFCQHPVRIDRIEIDHLGDEQQLPCDSRRGTLALQPLVDEALMRRMLIDDDDAVLRLRHDVGAVQLRAGGTEWRFLGLGLDLMQRRAAVGGGRGEIGQARLPLRKTGSG